MNSKRRVLKAMINVRVTPKLKRQLIRIARDKSTTLTDLLRDVLEDYSNKNG